MLTDLRYSLRKLAQSPGFTITAIAALALGIAANTSIFSVVNSVLLRPLPYTDPHRLAYVWEVSPRSGNRTNSVNPGNFHEWRGRNRSFERVAGFLANTLNLTGQGEPEQVKSAIVTQDFFPVLGLAPALGRNFSTEEVQPNGPGAVILSHNLWTRRYAADPNIIGRRVQVDGRETTVVGIDPKGFNYPRSADAWQPFNPRPTWRGRYMTVIARLKPGISHQAAQSDMDAIMHQLRAEHADFNAKWGINVMPMKDYETKDVKLALLVLLGAVGFVLLIACANVANLMLIRATGRAREIAVRASIGAGRWQLARQLLIESLLLALASGAVGLLFATWLTGVLIALTPENLALRNLPSVALDSRVLLFAFAASVFTGLLFGLTPALRASRIDLYEALKASRAPSGGLRRNRYRAALVIAEVALSMILLIGAGLLGRSFSKLMAVPPGFDPEHTLTLNVDILNRRGPQSSAFLESLLERIRAIPGVRAAGSAHFIPLTPMYSGTGFWRADRPVPGPGDQPVCEVSVITSGYFAAMGIPLQKGRLFDSRDIAGNPPLVIINQQLANQFFPNEDPIGKMLSIQWGDKPYQIIGVVGDIHSRGLEKKPMPTTYIHNLQEPINLAHLIIRTTSHPNQIAGVVKQEIRALDPNIPVSNMRTLEYYLSASVASQRFNTILLGGFSAIALLLAVIGVFGVISYTVSQRTQEIGIRMALGARGRDVSKLVIFEGMTLALIGITIGVLGAIALTRYLSTLLFNVTPLDLPTYAVVSLALGAAALAAAYLPARRAAKVDPMISLRYE
jgi:predicted permease